MATDPDLPTRGSISSGDVDHELFTISPQGLVSLKVGKATLDYETSRLKRKKSFRIIVEDSGRLAEKCAGTGADFFKYLFDDPVRRSY